MVLLREGMCPGLDQDLVRRLRDVHVKTVEDYVSSDIEDLARKCSASYTALMAIRRVLLAQHAAFPVSGADLYDELLSSSAILATGNPDLDTLLDSGVYTGEITELAGGPGSGKTQVCMGLAATVSHRLKQNVIYVDTTGGLTAGRLRQMLQSQTSSHDQQMEALQRITVYRAFDVFSLLDCLYRLSANGGRLRQACGSCVKALIVDSVSAVIAPLLGSKYQEGMLMMNQVAISLKTMAKDFNLATLVTNHVTQNDEGEVQPGLGVSWSHVPRTRVLLERLPDADRPTLRSVTLVKSSRQPCLLRAELDLQWWSHSDSEASRKTELDRGNS
ncbi:DNA repair protein RAD51 homolog 4 isoform X1 [Corythoichthys intestinalis]|uniref:DNA repair protein RAD51 homolog 4 isoform X1 n=1 Tax=Corythoichthys intestinalis TaxID=161448 RepID=UPI0025A62F94|nr:DNA repair protein RAD51 homolog 4 isoform X1 [Corythoichthys intestinalis]XP_061801563.1 DNA repair protein RAD51 homolog 4-like [Nerophis lumbriciformis]